MSRKGNNSNDSVEHHYYSTLNDSHEPPWQPRLRSFAPQFIALFSAGMERKKKRAEGESKYMQMWEKVDQIGMTRAYVQFSQDFSEKNPNTLKTENP